MATTEGTPEGPLPEWLAIAAAPPSLSLPIIKENITLAREVTHEMRPDGRNMTVFGGGSNVADERYAEDAWELGLLLGERGHNLVWGGNLGGVVGEVSQAAKLAGALLISVERGASWFSDADISFRANSLAERKLALVGLGDVAIALPGGLGTFDEVMTDIEFHKGRYRLPPLVLLNTMGYYDGLRRQMQAMIDGGFTKTPLEKIVRFADTPLEAIELAETVQAPPPPPPRKPKAITGVKSSKPAKTTK